MRACRVFAFFTALGLGASASEPFPVEHVNRVLPRWIRFGGEYRTRIESEDGIGFKPTEDLYLLSRFDPT
jgi:hypothetical protein